MPACRNSYSTFFGSNLLAASGGGRPWRVSIFRRLWSLVYVCALVLVSWLFFAGAAPAPPHPLGWVFFGRCGGSQSCVAAAWRGVVLEVVAREVVVGRLRAAKFGFRRACVVVDTRKAWLGGLAAFFFPGARACRFGPFVTPGPSMCGCASPPACMPPPPMLCATTVHRHRAGRRGGRQSGTSRAYQLRESARARAPSIGTLPAVTARAPPP